MSNASRGPSKPANYMLGHSDHELQRLATQARLVDPITRQFLIEAGIGRGMRVLDVGSGAGDVAILAAGLVGPTGEVIGADTAKAAVDAARARVREQALTNVTFRECDPVEVEFERPFDAIIGRYVLLFFADPVSTLRKLVRHLRPGGILFFHELDMAGSRSIPPAPTYDKCCSWIIKTSQRSGVDPQMGVKLYSVFVSAQLPPPVLQLRSVIGAGPGRIDVARLVADVVRTLLPTMERLQIATAQQVDIASLTDRIVLETECGTALVARAEVGAWTCV